LAKHGGKKIILVLSGFCRILGQHMFHELVIFVNANLAAQWWPLDFVKSMCDMFICKLLLYQHTVVLLLEFGRHIYTEL
jgi:hypothetical protein